jgi:hypothetical protein
LIGGGERLPGRQSVLVLFTPPRYRPSGIADRSGRETPYARLSRLAGNSESLAFSRD